MLAWPCAVWQVALGKIIHTTDLRAATVSRAFRRLAPELSSRVASATANDLAVNELLLPVVAHDLRNVFFSNIAACLVI